MRIVRAVKLDKYKDTNRYKHHEGDIYIDVTGGYTYMKRIDSRLLIQLLEQLSPEVNADSLECLLLANDNVVNCLINGNNNTGKSYWPNHKRWLIHARENFSDKMYTKEKYVRAGIVDLCSCCPRSIQDISSIEDRLLLMFEEIFYINYENNADLIKSKIIRTLTDFEAPEEDIQYIDTLNDLRQIADFLVGRASNKGFSTKRKSLRRPDTPITPISNDRTKVKILHEEEPVFLTYFELKRDGLSALDIAKQLVSNFPEVYKYQGKDVGTVKQWSEYIVASPEYWGFLCVGTKIIGNWSFDFLSAEQEKSVCTENFLERNTTFGEKNDLLGGYNDEVAILLHMSIMDGYQIQKNREILWKQFGETLQNLARSGIFYKSIYTVVGRRHEQIAYEKIGFKHLGTNSFVGEIYHLDLMPDFPEQLSWIMPDANLEDLYGNYWGKSITYRQLSHKDVLTEQQLMDISALIWDTDRYIYPAMMNRQQAKRILPLVFATNKDRMFSLDNIFVAMAGERVIGIILHKQGPLIWTSEIIRKMADFLEETLPTTLFKVEKEYFTEYDKTDANSTAIINCCVHSNWRMHDIRVGTHMMVAFTEAHHEKIELYVLQETLPAMRVYARSGFEIADVCNGFSSDNRKLPCAYMIRPSKKKA